MFFGVDKFNDNLSLLNTLSNEMKMCIYVLATAMRAIADLLFMNNVTGLAFILVNLVTRLLNHKAWQAAVWLP